MGGGLRVRGRAATSAPGRARARLRRRVHRQRVGPQPRALALQRRAGGHAAHEELLQRRHHRSAAQAGFGRLHVRHGRLDPDPGRGPHAAALGARRESTRLERQPDDGAGHRAAAACDPGAGRPRGGVRPAQERDRCGGRRARGAPARERRAPAAGGGERAQQRGPRGARPARAARGRPRSARERAPGPHAGVGRDTLRCSGARDPPARARAVRLAGGGGLRPHRHLHPGVRRAGELGGGRAERAHRQPRPPGRRPVHAARHGRAPHHGHAGPRQGPQLRALRVARARLPRGVPRAAERGDRGGDPDARARPDPRLRDDGREPGACPRPRASAWPRPSPSSTC